MLALRDYVQTDPQMHQWRGKCLTQGFKKIALTVMKKM